jgi:heme O synthase-like polyprenyltransferase
VGSSAKRAVAEGQADNEGMATVGIVLGWVSIGLSVLAVVALIAFVPAFFAFVDAIPDQP